MRPALLQHVDRGTIPVHPDRETTDGVGPRLGYRHTGAGALPKGGVGVASDGRVRRVDTHPGRLAFPSPLGTPMSHRTQPLAPSDGGTLPLGGALGSWRRACYVRSMFERPGSRVTARRGARKSGRGVTGRFVRAVALGLDGTLTANDELSEAVLVEVDRLRDVGLAVPLVTRASADTEPVRHRRRCRPVSGRDLGLSRR